MPRAMASAGDDPRELGASGAQQAGDADHFAGVQREADVRQSAWDSHAIDAQQLGAALDARLRKMLLEIAIRHQTHELGDAHLADRSRRDVSPITEHGDAAADAEHLVEPVRDVDDRHAPRRQTLDQRKQLRHFPARQRRGRLVHHENARVAGRVHRRLGGGGLVHRSLGGGGRERFGNLDHLALRQPEARHERPWIGRRFLEPEIPQQRRRARVERSPVDDAGHPRRRRPEKNIFGDRELRNEVQLLIDDADAERERVARAADLHRLAMDDDLARVLAIRAAEDLHQRRLPGAVLAEEHVHVAGLERQVDAVERDDARERLADPPHLEDRCGGRHRIGRSNGGPPAVIVAAPSHCSSEGPGR